jgi:hypothetical protein
MSAQPIYDHQPPRIPKTVAGIRAALPLDLRTQFNAELAEIDLDDLVAVARLRDTWWAQAWIESDPGLKSDLEAAGRGELEFFPSPFPR